MPSLPRGIAFAAAGGAVGAAIWAAITYFTGYEIGLIAWLVGGLVGAGFAMGTKGQGSGGRALLAATIALVAVLGGKLLAANLYARHLIAAELSTEIDDEAALAALHDKVYQEFTDEGVEVSEPEWDEDSEAFAYPPEVIREASRRWSRMLEPERDAFVAGLNEERTAELGAASSITTLLFFVFSFGLTDLLFLGLAVSTAYKFGLGVTVATAETTVSETTLVPSGFHPLAAPAQPGATPGVDQPFPDPLDRILEMQRRKAAEQGQAATAKLNADDGHAAA